MSAIVIAAIGVAAGLVALVLKQIIATEITGWVPPLGRMIIRRGTARLPPEHRARYLEEWLAELATFEGRPLTGLLTALRILRGAGRTGQAVRANTASDTRTVAGHVPKRAAQEHAELHNALARHIASTGLVPLARYSEGPHFDLAWKSGDTVCVAEVKSTTPQNEERQLGLAVGQILRYSHLISSKTMPLKVIAVSHPTRDLSWIDFCERLGIILVWPERFNDLP
jgi:hypothetical protein